MSAVPIAPTRKALSVPKNHIPLLVRLKNPNELGPLLLTVGCGMAQERLANLYGVSTQTIKNRMRAARAAFAEMVRGFDAMEQDVSLDDISNWKKDPFPPGPNLRMVPLEDCLAFARARLYAFASGQIGEDDERMQSLVEKLPKLWPQR